MSERIQSAKQFLIAMSGLIAAAVFGSVAFGRGRGSVVLLLVAGGVGIAAAGLLLAAFLYFMSTRLLLRNDRLELVTFGSRKQWPRSTLARVARCAIRSPMAFNPDRLFVILNSDGRALLWLRTAYWSEASLVPLWEALHLTPGGSWDELDSYDDAAERFPAA
jgi:hypothetical protein